MKIEFEWHTDSLEEGPPKGRLEEKILKEVSDHLNACVDREVESLVVSLHDAEASEYYLKGAAFSVEEDGTRNEVLTFKVDRGLLLQCKKTAWYKPGKIIE